MLLTIILFIVGLIAAYFIAKWQMKKNKIVHYTINNYDIGKRLRNDFPEVEMHYSGDVLANNVKVLKGGFMNTGNNDIEETKFSLVLPQGCIIKTLKVIPSKEDLIVKEIIDPDRKNTVQFVVEGVFIKDEYFEYAAIVETPDGIEDFSEKLSFQHRIKNTEKIKNTFIGEYQKEIKKKKIDIDKIGSVLMPIIFGFMMMVVLFSAVFCRPMQHKIFQKDSDKEVKVYITPKSTIIVADPNRIPNPFGESITLDDFDQHYRVELINTFKWSFGDVFLIIVISLGLIAVISLSLIVSIDKNNHIIKVLEKSKK